MKIYSGAARGDMGTFTPARDQMENFPKLQWLQYYAMHFVDFFPLIFRGFLVWLNAMSTFKNVSLLRIFSYFRSYYVRRR